MKCNNCTAEWNVTEEIGSTIKNCPFCGNPLIEEKSFSGKFTDVPSCFKYLFSTYGTDIITNKSRFLSLVSDFMPSCDTERRLLGYALNADIYTRFIGLDESKIESERLSAVMILTDKFLLSQAHAEKAASWIIEALFEGYATAQAPSQAEAPAPQVKPTSPASAPAGTTSAAAKKTKHSFPGGEYEGDVVGGKRQGYGKMTWNDGSEYIGYWDNDTPHGKGTFKSNGVLTYDGNWKHNEWHGYGVWYYSTGAKYYDGQWQDGKRHGYGTEYDGDGKILYQGQWRDGEKATSTVERKKLSYHNGDYVGDVVAGKKHGKGVMHYLDGTRYEGQWQNDKRHGKGTLYYSNGSICYRGDWQNDMRHGEGELYWKNVFQLQYKGGWKGNKRDGYGTEYSFLGYAVYQGNWSNGKRDGYGTEYDSTGKVIYRGQWHHGEKG